MAKYRLRRMKTDPTRGSSRADASGAAVHPEIQDLKRLVKLALRQRKRRSAERWPKPLLFLAPEAPRLPAALIEDTALTPVDMVLWLRLRIRLSEGSTERTLPSIRELAQTSSLGSRETIGRSLAILRCRRYLTVCATAWHGGDRKVGTAFVLHAPRISVTDAMFLDSDYRVFLKKLVDHPAIRLRKVARNELAKLPMIPD